MTVKGGTTPACAACKYQRRKCSPTCPLAPYFPANQPKMFQNVHRLFGVSNVTKTLERLSTKEQREDAMRSIIYEAEIRERFPVHGCCRVIDQLKNQLILAYQEMRLVCANLDACREQVAAAGKPGDCWLEYVSTSGNEAAHYGAASPLGQVWPQSSDCLGPSSLLHYGVGQFLLSDNDDAAKPLLTALEPCSDTMSSDLSSIQTQMEAFGIHKRNVLDFEAQHFSNAAAVFDDRQSSYIETKNEAFEPSLESTLDDTVEHGCRREMRGGAAAAEHGCRRELRSAAAGFGLTAVN